MPIDQQVFRAPTTPAATQPGLGERVQKVLEDVMASAAQLDAQDKQLQRLKSWQDSVSEPLTALPQALQAIVDLQTLVGGTAPGAIGTRLGDAEQRLEELSTSLVEQLSEMRNLEGALRRILDELAGGLITLKQSVDRDLTSIRTRLDGLTDRIDECCDDAGNSKAAAKRRSPSGG